MAEEPTPDVALLPFRCLALDVGGFPGVCFRLIRAVGGQRGFSGATKTPLPPPLPCRYGR